jgi:hypothetical protein
MRKQFLAYGNILIKQGIIDMLVLPISKML